MKAQEKTGGKLERIETLLRALALVVLVASCIAQLETPAARMTLGAAIAYLAWIVISTTGAKLKIGGVALRSWWVVAVDMILISTAILAGRTFLDELSAMALMVPIGIMTLRGKLTLSVAMAILATGVAYALASCRFTDPGHVQVIAHTFAWLAIFSMVAFSSRAGAKALEVSDLEESEADERLDMLLVRAPEILTAGSHRLTVRRITEVAREIFEAESASIMEKGESGMSLAGLSRRERYFDPTEEDDREQGREATTRVSIADYVAYNGQPLLLNHELADDPRFRNLAGRSGVHSAMSVPVMLGDSLYGVLNITQLDENTPKFSDADLRVARVLSYISAIALGRHRG